MLWSWRRKHSFQVGNAVIISRLHPIGTVHVPLLGTNVVKSSSLLLGDLNCSRKPTLIHSHTQPHSSAHTHTHTDINT